MKTLVAIMLSLLTTAAYAEPFEGAKLSEKEIRALYNSHCSQFMVDSTSSKSAMPRKLEDILNQGERLITAKVLSCNLRGIVFEFYLEKSSGQWVMFDAESITISSKGPR